ncbi:hypothetical protein [Phormidesmis priestleyi]
MVTVLDDTRRSAIAMELADLKALQELLIATEQKLLPKVSSDQEIGDRLSDFLRDDQENLTVLNGVLAKFGSAAQPRDTTHQYIEQVNQLMDGDELTLYQKVSAHERIKHQAVMTGLIVHKASQAIEDEELKTAIAPLNQVNFKNRAHQEQLKGVMEVLGTRELTGKDPDQSVWARTQDAVAALRGVFDGLTQ